MPVARKRLDNEALIEGWVEKDPSLIGLDILVLGTQITTDHGGRIDLLGMDADGNLVVVELMSEAAVRRYALHGVHGMQRIWQKVLSAHPEAAAEMPERAQRAREIMHRASEVADAAKQARLAGDKDGWRERSAEAAGLWGDALIALGAVAIDEETGRLSRPAERLRGMYEEAANRYGEMGRRWIGFEDTGHNPETGEFEKWRAPKWTMVKKSSDDNDRTLADRVPRGAAGAVRGDPPDGAEDKLRSHILGRVAAVGPENLRL
ncbi:MAG: hypothetical protein H7Z12_18585 [Rhodospirillaceae bacterium]|nr:hypothetical protein [Rhodospirillales bacterium]